MLVEIVESEDDIKEVEERLSIAFSFSVTHILQSHYTVELLFIAIVALFGMNEQIHSDCIVAGFHSLIRRGEIRL